jgi:hypothetical protein
LTFLELYVVAQQFEVPGMRQNIVGKLERLFSWNWLQRTSRAKVRPRIEVVLGFLKDIADRSLRLDTSQL